MSETRMMNLFTILKFVFLCISPVVQKRMFPFLYLDSRTRNSKFIGEHENKEEIHNCMTADLIRYKENAWIV